MLVSINDGLHGFDGLLSNVRAIDPSGQENEVVWKCITRYRSTRAATPTT